MKVTYNWLKDFVEIKIAPGILADKLTMAGLEVVALRQKDGDFVFEIEVTSNRPDWLSVVGIAREVAAITGQKLRKVTGSPARRLTRLGGRQPFVIKIEDKKDCSLYAAKIIQGVEVGPSPDWLKKRLELVGCRSVNNVVDITNYVLFQLGEPLHAFDLDKLDRQQAIIVRRAKAKEIIITIDGEQKILNPNILVIADTKKAVAVAGIMGGKDTEVTEDTKNVLLEAAVFNPIIVRRGRQALGLQSEAAYRFERGVDVETARNASWLATELIEKATGGRCVLVQSSGKPKTKARDIDLSPATASKILGINIAPAAIKRILNNLGFTLRTKTKNNFTVRIPSHRQDVNLEIDLIEEIARISGYEDIPRSLPAVKPQVAVGQMRDSVSGIKNTLAADSGLNEVITYSLIDKDLLKGFWKGEAGDLIEILNPLSKEQEILRPLLMPSLISCLAYNLRQKQSYVNIFEIAKTYIKLGNKIQEQYFLGIALCGTKPVWFEQGRVQDEAGFLHLKGILEVMFQRLGLIRGEYRFVTKGNSDEFEVYAKGRNLGILRRLDRGILDRLDIKNKEVFAAEIALEEFLSYVQVERKFVPLPRYPGIYRDISLSLKESITIDQIRELIMQRAGDLLHGVTLTDYYKGKPIEPGYKGLTVSCFYCSSERTLTEAEINPVHVNVIQGLEEQFQAKIR